MSIFLPEDQRQPLPPTRPDEEAEDHKATCMCEVCKRPNSMELKRKHVKRFRF